MAESGPIGELFEKIGDALDRHADEWEDFSIPLKAAFARKEALEGTIKGGTPGHLETLRVMAASGLAEESGAEA